MNASISALLTTCPRNTGLQSSESAMPVTTSSGSFGFHLFKYSAEHMIFKHGGSIGAWNIGQSFLKSFAKIRDWHIGSTDESMAMLLM